MCGIAGLFAKSPDAESRLGAGLAAMLAELAARGPDSAGFAVYRDPAPEGAVKLSLLDPRGGSPDWPRIASDLGQALAADVSLEVRGGSCAIARAAAGAAEAEAALRALAPDIAVIATGQAIELVKRAGPPAELIAGSGLAALEGTHALGHTRMATESRVTTEHSHPFSTGPDLCLVHNGSLSNHNRLRAALRREGLTFATDNDSEVAAGYLTWRMAGGATLDEALEGALRDLDGFFTFAVGTRDGFAVLRDPIACKPAVLAETDGWVAMASEYRAIAVLPGAEDAEVWEPAPGRIYSWSHAAPADAPAQRDLAGVSE
jgi:glutamate synthase domain-containing protein 1